jgi:cell division protein FtsB
LPRPSASRLSRLIQIGLALAALTLVVESLFGTGGLAAMMQARREYAVLASDLDRVRAENQRLQAEAKRLREDPTAIEEAARRDLGYMSPGEKVFILHDAKPAPSTPPLSTEKK